MNNTPGVSAVLFAKDFEKLAAFYCDALGLTRVEAGPDHVILTNRGFDLVVHQIPAHLAAGIRIEQPPKIREEGSVKLSFPVDAIAASRERSVSMGGGMDAPDLEWTWDYDGRRTCKGFDPEGNVFQVHQFA